MSLFDLLEPKALKALRSCMRPVHFPKGACLMHEGDPGNGCYLIESGEVRLELHNIETDSEGILCYLGPDSLLGEFSLLDGEPRSASAFAESDTEARWLSKDDFDDLCQAKPDVGVEILSAFGRHVTNKLRLENRHMADHIFSDQFDHETQQMVAQSVAAQKEFAGWSEARVDALLQDIADVVASQAKSLARANVVDTGIGMEADKIVKIEFACRAIVQTLMGRKAAGPLQDDPGRVMEIASPVGVVLGIIPVTNPVSTIAFKTLICLKGRNALIFSCPREALRVGNMAGELIHLALARHEAPAGLVQWIKNQASRRKTTMFMKHPDVSFILATGGPSIVKASYSSGKPAIGVGAGNAPVLICADADLPAAADKVIVGKSFDNGIICGSENNLVIVKTARTEFLKHMEANGAVVLKLDEKNRMTAKMFDPEDGHLRREFVGKSAAHIAKEIGMLCPASPRLLVVPVGVDEVRGHYGHEKLAPIVSLFTVADEEEGLAICKSILEQQGKGHTAIIHTSNKSLARRFALEIPASRILVNVSGSLGCIGIGSGLPPSLTLGCGTYGGNSTTDNVTYTHVLNIKRLAFGAPHESAKDS